MNAETVAAELIRFQTESPEGNEEQCARYLSDLIAELHLDNFQSELHTIGEKRANLIIRLGPTGAPGLLLSAHTDTVKAGNLEDWSSNPFEATIREGKMFGRGAADTKAGLASLASSLEVLKGKRMSRGLVFVATAGEENGCQGMKAILRDNMIARGEAIYGIVAEPTGLKIVRKHKGVTRFRISFKGKSSHASAPKLGVNSIEAASVFMSRLMNYRVSLESETDPDLGYTVMPVTVIEGGIRGRYNVIPESCELFINCRRIPSHSAQLVLDRLSRIAKETEAEQPGLGISCHIDYDIDALDVPTTSPMVKMCEQITNESSISAPYGTEAPYYRELGIECVVLGPGSIDQAHTINEFVPLPEISRATSIYKTTIEKVCL